MSESVNEQDLNQSIRTRIAAALRHMTGDLTYEAMADAVIRELKKDYMLVPNPDETYQTPRTEWIAEDGSTWVT